MKRNDPQKASALLAWAGVLALSAGVDLPTAQAQAPAKAGAPGQAAKVSYLTGQAELARTKHGKKGPLKVGSEVVAGDRIHTGGKTRVELTFPDGSRIRIGPATHVTLDQSQFEGQKREAVSATVWVGRIWAKVAKAVGAGQTFEVHTKNAVSGVRGTSFTVVAASDSSALVRVYAGTVGIKKKRKGYADRKRQEVPGPQQIDKKQWEEIIATAMKQVRISSKGEISKAESFEDSGREADWAKWNQQRDAQASEE